MAADRIPQTPEVTCVIPTFNDRVNLPRAVQSVLRQEKVEVEVLLVDDCSDAQTRDFLVQFAATDARIRLFLLPENGGQSRARNIGGALARGRFVTFLDQDDEHAPGWYRDALDYIAGYPNLGVLSGLSKVVDLPDRFGGIDEETDVRIYGLTFVFMTNVIMLRSVFLASGGFPVAPIWRTPIAGEDGVYRHGLARNWNMVQVARVALFHHAREGGATVFFLDRSEARESQVVMKRLESIEMNGELESAQEEFWSEAKRAAEEVRLCGKRLEAAVDTPRAA